MQMKSLSQSRAMPVLCFLNLLWSLVRNHLSTFLPSITQRFGFDVESLEVGSDFHDANELLLLIEEEAREPAVERGVTSPEHESAEFELPASGTVSDDGMDETEHSVSALFQGSPSPPKRSDSDNEFGCAAIQQQLEEVQQMKVENKTPKSQGLHTILEDRESRKMVEDMKPLKLNKTEVEHKDLVEQVLSFHEVYSRKMHELDVLNQQIPDALSFTGLKNHALEDFMQTRKKKKMLSLTFGAMRSAFGVKYLCARVSCDEAEALKSSGGLMSKSELIYVGQHCLSWEILNWQYSRAIKLQALDLQASHLYNQVADEFQQFQVALQRFVENEASQGPNRVRNYIEKRAAFCEFLQVPTIKDDCLKDKKFNEGECFVTISSLVKIIDTCRRVFDEFLREKTHGGTGTKVVPSDQSRQALFVQAQTKLHKIKKRVRELKRSKGGIVKMMYHAKDEPLLDRELFDARVELKLVARVLRMSEICRDQILWCHRKLDEIKLVARRLYIEPTFLLFPC